jgi:hypothetical protein
MRRIVELTLPSLAERVRLLAADAAHPSLRSGPPSPTR